MSFEYKTPARTPRDRDYTSLFHAAKRNSHHHLRALPRFAVYYYVYFVSSAFFCLSTIIRASCCARQNSTRWKHLRSGVSLTFVCKYYSTALLPEEDLQYRAFKSAIYLERFRMSTVEPRSTYWHSLPFPAAACIFSFPPSS